MNENLAELLQSAAALIGSSGLISALILRRIDRLERKLDARENDRVEENIVRGEAIIAAGCLAEANTLAIRAVTSEEACKAELDAHRHAAARMEQFTRSKSAEYLHAN